MEINNNYLAHPLRYIPPNQKKEGVGIVDKLMKYKELSGYSKYKNLIWKIMQLL